jgi:cysteine synthase A
MDNPSILTTIGSTALLYVDGVWIKCEYQNPSGAIKDRMVSYIIERAEKEGLIRPGMTLCEATSGNTGNALAMIGAAKGYKVRIVMPHGYSPERLAISRAYGAEVELVGNFYLNEAIARVQELAKQPGFWAINQFDSEWNIDENELCLGQEILSQLPKGVKIDAIIQGMGTGGTLIGVARALKKAHNPNLKVCAIEPEESPTLSQGKVGKHHIEGISDGFIPGIIQRNRSMIDEILLINSQEAIAVMRWLAAKHGFLVGPSSAANFLAAQELKRRHPEMKNILTFFCDQGTKYLSEYYK